jgi:hypothetical protein
MNDEIKVPVTNNIFVTHYSVRSFLILPRGAQVETGLAALRSVEGLESGGFSITVIFTV